MTPYLIIDLIILVIIAFFALRGLKKGLVMAVAGAVIFIVALVGAYFAVGMFSPRVESVIEPSIRNWVENRASERLTDAVDGGIGGITDSMLFDALQKFGFGEGQASQISGNVSDRIGQTGQSITHALTTALTATLANIITFVIAFLLIMAALHLAARLLDTIVKLPLLNTINKLGGFVGGTLQGVVIVWIIVYCLRFVGVISPEVAAETYLLRFFGGR
jgi:uncharacterized membrane protein required for colicin V production